MTTPFPPGTYPIPPRATSITIPAPAPVTITAPEPVWGYPAPLAGANAVAWQAVNADAGPLGCWRSYNREAIGVPSTWPGPQAGVIPPGAVPIVSIRPDISSVLSGSLDAALAAYFLKVPDGAIVTCWHEGEAASWGYTPAEILGLHEHVYPIFEDNAAPGASYVQIWTAYSATNGRVTPFASPVVDGHFVDVYMTSAADTCDWAGPLRGTYDEANADRMTHMDSHRTLISIMGSNDG